MDSRETNDYSGTCHNEFRAPIGRNLNLTCTVIVLPVESFAPRFLDDVAPDDLDGA